MPPLTWGLPMARIDDPESVSTHGRVTHDPRPVPPNVDRTSPPGDHARRGGEGSEGSWPSASHDRREGGSDPSEDVDSVRSGSRSGDAPPVDPASKLFEAFREGDPVRAYEEATNLLRAYDRALDEIGRLRFRVNFGSSLCERCDGLRAGPGVVATCYQVQRCHYGNVREGQDELSRRRVLEVISRRTK